MLSEIEAEAVARLRAFDLVLARMETDMAAVLAAELPGATWIEAPADALASIRQRRAGIGQSIRDIETGRARGG